MATATAIAMFSISHSSSSSAFLWHITIHFPKVPTSISAIAVVALHSHEWLFLVNSSRTWRRLSFRPANNFLIQCNCFKSPTAHMTEAEIVAFFQQIGVSEKETESILEQNPTLRSTFWDQIRARILSIRSVGLKGISLYRVIVKCPNLLIAKEIDSFICFVRIDLEGKLEPMQVERLLTATETRFLVGFDQKVRRLLQHFVPEEKFVHVLNIANLSQGISLKSIEEIERTMAFLNPFGGIEIIVRCLKILNYDLVTQLIPRISFLKDLSGGDVDAVVAVLQKFLIILNYSVKHLEKHVEFLKSFVGLNDQEIFKIILVFPGVISGRRERKLRPRLEFLKHCGLDSNDIFKFLTKAPLFLALSFDNIAHKLGLLVKNGYEYRTKEMAAAMGAVTRTSCENMQNVIEVFLSYGLSSTDVLSMSKKHPQILQYNHSSLEEKWEYLIIGLK